VDWIDADARARAAGVENEQDARLRWTAWLEASSADRVVVLGQNIRSARQGIKAALAALLQADVGVDAMKQAACDDDRAALTGSKGPLPEAVSARCKALVGLS